MNALDRERIYAAGEDKGRAAGSWVVDGNTSAEWARLVLTMLDDGDPAVEGYIVEPPLAVESEAEEVRRDLLADPDSDEWMDAYEEGFSAGFWEKVETDLRTLAGP